MSAAESKKRATNHLDYLRNGTTLYDYDLRALREHLANDGLTVADIGTSEEELERLWVWGCKLAATNHLRYLRAGAPEYDYNLRILREHLANGRLTVNDIGTSDKELESLRFFRP